MTFLTLYQVDAFTDRVFGGNPAAVIPVSEWLPDPVLQSIAAENNLSETAFFILGRDPVPLRWFTPSQEVPLCGHATLASAFVLMTLLEPERTAVEFTTLSGILQVKRGDNHTLIMTLPRRDPVACPEPLGLAAALGYPPQEVFGTQDDKNYYVVYDNAEVIQTLRPDMDKLKAFHPYSIVVTAPGDEPATDFVCRYFAPTYGIPEDPVTGSIQCGLVPYWGRRLGVSRLHSRQLSVRGGSLDSHLTATTVEVSGHAVLYLNGQLHLDALTF